MKLTFDYYHNLEKIDLYLCNPDGRELFILPGTNRNLALRFNDLSELTFEVNSKTILSDGTVVDLEAYDYIQTKRLIYATNIGWFQITEVDEQDNGDVKYKNIKTESYQSVLKNKGFVSEERVYCFYNPNDPYDDRYDSFQDDSIPSVVGQWSKQLGIKIDLTQGTSEPQVAYDDWTVTYVTPSLIFEGEGSACRTFKENVTYGYDWIVNDVESAFEVVVLFDFMYKTIHVLIPDEVTQKANIIYTFNNFMKNVDINEASEDIVTVLSCNGDNCDISGVNPTGTNYICDFSYYMDKVNYRWMSPELIEKLEQWKIDCDSLKSTYEDRIKDLRALYKEATENETILQEMSLSLADLRTAQNKRSIVGTGSPGALCGIVTAESVSSGKKSIKSGTDYYLNAFTGEEIITAYQFSPTYDVATRRWIFNNGLSKRGTANSIIAENLSDDNHAGVSYWYFSDASDGSSYCKLKSSVSVNKDSITSTYYCGGFDRYVAYTYPIVNGGTTVYTDTLQEWINLREFHVNALNISLYGYARQLNGYQYDDEGEVITPTSDSIYGQINAVNEKLNEISDRLNILVYFSDTPKLLRELNCYWIEGDYTNENIAVLEETTPEEELDLANELLASGYIELSKVCQPRFTFSLESIDATKHYEFREQMHSLELGKIITIEKEEGLWYYPALLEISMSLDNNEEFSMTFGNSLRLDDWGYTYADLISDASSTSRKISANWQNILAYAKDRDHISSLIKDPLDATLRASFANMVNQEFTIDSNGILGRKKVSTTSDEFENEQVRLLNNLIIFTNDNWETAKTALGKINYTDDDGNSVSAYGLIAETIIGSLIMGERLKIKNENNTIELGSEGIIIKNPDGAIMFWARPGYGLEVAGKITATDGIIGGCEIVNGNLQVNAMNITGTITASQIDASNLYVNAANIRGKLTADQVEAIEIDASQIDVSNLHVKAANIDGTLSASQINADGLSAKDVSISGMFSSTGTSNNTATLSDGYIALTQNWYACTTTQTVSSTWNEISNGRISISIGVDNGGDERGYIGCGSSTINFTQAQAQLYGTWLGTSSVAISSDKNKKHDIEPFSEKYENLFDNLEPRLYKYNDGQSGRTHTGFIAQDVENSIYNSGLTTSDFAGFIKAEYFNEEDKSFETSCFLRYEEFISLNTWQIQKLKTRVSELENIVARLQKE
nr:MAG TPA: tail protein [Caudoviricetes sp.]